MDKKTIGELAEYVNINFPKDSMNVSSGLDIISAALESIRKNIIVQQESLKKLDLNIDAGELDDFLVIVDDLLEKSELYAVMFDVSPKEEDLDFLNLPVDYGPEH